MFHVRHLDKNGNLKAEFDVPNGITNVGKNHILGVEFHGDTQLTSWYLGLIDNAAFGSLNAADTMASHSGWNELDTASNTIYSQTTRPAWGPDASSGQAITNGSPVVFSIIATAAAYGFFVTSNSTKAGTTGTLWTTAAFSAVCNLSNGDTLNVTYTITM